MNDWKQQLTALKLDLPPMKNEQEPVPKTIVPQYSKWIDTHAHYDHIRFSKDRDSIMNAMKQDVSHVITLGTDIRSNDDTIKLIEAYEFLWGMVGFFPTSVFELETPGIWGNFIRQLFKVKIVGIGEIGLDYHWDSVGPKGNLIKGEAAREMQKKWLMKQMDLAAEMDIPVSLHSREAEQDTIAVFDRYSEIKGVMHCFSYGLNSAHYYLNKGLYLGVGGASTYRSNQELKDVIKEIPLNRLLLETDAPYLSPSVVRSQKNDSRNIRYVIENIAEIKGVSPETVIYETNRNAKQLFLLPE